MCAAGRKHEGIIGGYFSVQPGPLALLSDQEAAVTAVEVTNADAGEGWWLHGDPHDYNSTRHRSSVIEHKCSRTLTRSSSNCAAVLLRVSKACMQGATWAWIDTNLEEPGMDLRVTTPQ